LTGGADITIVGASDKQKLQRDHAKNARRTAGLRELAVSPQSTSMAKARHSRSLSLADSPPPEEKRRAAPFVTLREDALLPAAELVH
jgi:hypothetical protein